MAPRKPKIRKKSPADIKRAIEMIEAEIQKEKTRQEKDGKIFVALTHDELVRKLRRANSPMITWQSWGGVVSPGGTNYYSLGVSNPDPVAWDHLALSVSIGNRNAIANNDLFMSDFDHRFPTLAQKPPFGFTLGPVGSQTASTSLSFELKIPSGIDKTGYFGNSVLIQLNPSSVGTYLDRSVFFFSVA